MSGIGYSDGLYGRSKGGKTFSGWTCEHLPYLVELDNFGASRHQGQPGGPNERLYVWGYDEITWFAHQTREYRAQWLQYAWDWLRDTDTNAHLQMPGSRTATSSDTRWYFANNKSDTVPNGSGDEGASNQCGDEGNDPDQHQRTERKREVSRAPQQRPNQGRPEG